MRRGESGNRMNSIRLLLDLPVNYHFAREAFLAIAEEARTYANVLTQLKLPHESYALALKNLNAHALITAPTSLKDLEEVVSLSGIPKVCVANHLATHDRLPVVGNDDAAVGRLAAEYFEAAGFKHFGYFTNSSTNYFQARQDAFIRAVEASGNTCHGGPEQVNEERVSLDRLCEWLNTLPKPLAVFCPYDGHARDVINACNLGRLRVPEAVSVIGVDNDPVACLSTSPPLASVATAAAQIGREALNLVLSLVRGGEPPPHPVLIPPTGLAIRESCGERAISDETVAAAVSFIRRNIRERITVARIADAVAVSERTLHRKFDEVLQRSPIDEIRRARVAHAKRLLIDTDLPLADVARRSGMIRAQRLANLLKQQEGLTPLQFRKQHGRSNHRPER